MLIAFRQNTFEYTAGHRKVAIPLPLVALAIEAYICICPREADSRSIPSLRSNGSFCTRSVAAIREEKQDRKLMHTLGLFRNSAASPRTHQKAPRSTPERRTSEYCSSRGSKTLARPGYLLFVAFASLVAALVASQVVLLLDGTLEFDGLLVLSRQWAIARFLSLMHLLLWRHGVRALLCSLLLLEICLILQCLLLVGCHVRLLLGLVAWHALWWHALWHGRRGGVLLFW